MKIAMPKRLFGCIILFSLVLMAAGGGMADEPSRVVIVPFKVHADRDLTFLQEGILEMLTSRLSWENKVVVVSREDTNEAIKDLPMPLNEEAARTIGARLQASHVLFGSLTMFGSSVSLDGKMVDVYQRRPTLTFFKQSDEIDKVIPQVNLFASEIQEKVFGRPVAVPQPVAPTPETPDIFAHPEKLLGQEPGDQAAVSDDKPAPAGVGGFVESGVQAPPAMVSPELWKSQNFNTVIKGIALGDVDGDRKTEVVFISDRRIYVHRHERQYLSKIWEEDGKRNQRFIGVDVADVNGNGRSEIFVTSIKGTGERLDSFVLEWNGDDFVRVSDDNPWYYRVINVPDLGPVLLGQKRRMDQLFADGVYQLTWRDGEYGPEERLALPEGINIFGFALGDVMNNGEQMIAAFDGGDHICLFSLSGEERWKSDERYGGNMNYLAFSSSSADDMVDRLYLPQRIFISDLDNDGKNEVIVCSNEGPLGRLFARFRQFKSGHVASLSWNDLKLTLNRRTAESSGYISDFAIGDFDHDGGDEVVAAHVGKQGTGLTSAGSSIIAYETPERSSSAH
ncbi:MAG: VCBS repeat-containing protein [Desulfobacterales bacterium]|nr:MAG: VCBS repeat-containing protein [Desulfobacterales bacterium]